MTKRTDVRWARQSRKIWNRFEIPGYWICWCNSHLAYQDCLGLGKEIFIKISQNTGIKMLGGITSSGASTQVIQREIDEWTVLITFIIFWWVILSRGKQERVVDSLWSWNSFVHFYSILVNQIFIFNLEKMNEVYLAGLMGAFFKMGAFFLGGSFSFWESWLAVSAILRNKALKARNEKFEVLIINQRNACFWYQVFARFTANRLGFCFEEARILLEGSWSKIG